MARMIVNLPAMYADHHVIAVRRILLEHPGVLNVVASSAFLRVEVEYDPSAASPEQVRRVLADAGYPEGETAEIGLLRGNGHGDPAWARLGVRATQTNTADRKPSA